MLTCLVNINGMRFVESDLFELLRMISDSKIQLKHVKLDWVKLSNDCVLALIDFLQKETARITYFLLYRF
jgi:hypothetical protein